MTSWQRCYVDLLLFMNFSYIFQKCIKFILLYRFLKIWKENQTNSRFNKKSIRVWNWNYLYVIRLSLARAVLKHYPSNFDFQIEQKIWNHNSFYLISVRPNTQKTLLNFYGDKAVPKLSQNGCFWRNSYFDDLIS